MPATTAVLASVLLFLSPSGSAGGMVPAPAIATAWTWRQEPAFQVRIERHTTIRVSPRASSMPMPPHLLMEWPREMMEPRVYRRRIGKCLPMAGIAGVQAEGRSTLLLFMRDRRLISAELERACRARDFYSGFYLAENKDGQLCVDRDSLQSRSGVNCRLKGIRQIVLLDD